MPRRHTELRTYAQKEEKPPVLKKRPRKGRAAEDEAEGEESATLQDFHAWGKRLEKS